MSTPAEAVQWRIGDHHPVYVFKQGEDWFIKAETRTNKAINLEILAGTYGQVSDQTMKRKVMGVAHDLHEALAAADEANEEAVAADQQVEQIIQSFNPENGAPDTEIREDLEELERDPGPSSTYIEKSTFRRGGVRVRREELPVVGTPRDGLLYQQFMDVVAGKRVTQVKVTFQDRTAVAYSLKKRG